MTASAMHLDRVLQLQLLTALREEYPEHGDLEDLFGPTSKKMQANLFYLAEHGLIEPSGIREALGAPRMMLMAKITADGLDFLEADGGLKAILNVVTVRLDAESVRGLIEAKISESTIAKEQKDSLLQKVRGFSGDMLKAVVIKLVEIGIENPSQVEKMIKMLANI